MPRRSTALSMPRAVSPAILDSLSLPPSAPAHAPMTCRPPQTHATRGVAGLLGPSLKLSLGSRSRPGDPPPSTNGARRWHFSPRL
ncbi:hypothetical protein K488DRAFT_92733 [Vararia minispora EC-137]|uniref:Uncharacterized protein n=1 Tax=Vararia minispora EC-137 TaxID=1314806 RepID=A0ACB8Q3R5_9AGAM|nr:hypothetical protein K488DRAFT_92733 [Vararia minispora EC-137]